MTPVASFIRSSMDCWADIKAACDPFAPFIDEGTGLPTVWDKANPPGLRFAEPHGERLRQAWLGHQLRCRCRLEEHQGFVRLSLYPYSEQSWPWFRPGRMSQQHYLNGYPQHISIITSQQMANGLNPVEQGALNTIRNWFGDRFWPASFLFREVSGLTNTGGHVVTVPGGNPFSSPNNAGCLAAVRFLRQAGQHHGWRLTISM